MAVGVAVRVGVGVRVGVVLEIPGTIRLLDVFDLDGNRLQLSEEL